MELGLAGKTVVVTGGASWIGRGIVLSFAKEGSSIVIADIDEVQAEKTADLARKQGGRVLVIRTDVTKPEQCEAMIKKTLDELGRLDVLVNNAGGSAKFCLFVQKSKETSVKEMDVNYWGTFNCTRAVIEYMIAQKRGRIVNLGSDAGRVGVVAQVNYAAAKGAVISFTKALALEVGRYGINVNAVCPGAVFPESITEEMGESSAWREAGAIDEFTPEMRAKWIKAYPLRRLGKPENIANMVVFLASDAADWITGQAISVDGGIVMI